MTNYVPGPASVMKNYGNSAGNLPAEIMSLQNFPKNKTFQIANIADN